ncbi:hypothetical protein [Spirosoma sp.]|uniref:hypothetical protein n=1 Tax=Spirosoma sp. TaxID=1899569 RepID=UPI00260199AF|nr:hypothetical protein [Spirosoma sp.]MCX6212877.1 hypothetical protein [Spirosoma sp.]
MEKDFLRLVHDLRSHFTIICYAIHCLEGKLPPHEQEDYQEMLARNLGTIQSIVEDLALPKLKERGQEDELRIELKRLLDYLAIKRSTVSQTYLQEQVNQLIGTLKALCELVF